ncbi:uncharacterized protein PRCAT00004821001 [Priceomyces carsonii]|uniref:uncharacterized protein n=1 Tax=Priceomyces carsonii TaxID=28549 RepID=UPI002ED87A55|nr:unnamed protein product [Priceomyces carsonii]
MLSSKHQREEISYKENVIQLLLVLLNVSIRLYSALYMIISDCDETFNYWEPLNMLTRGFGKETWEYSPEYAIRSYAYLIPYYILSYPVNYLVEFLGLPSYYVFYWIRIVALCGFTCFTEIHLFNSIKGAYSKRIAYWFLFLTSVAPGMSHAGVALLPSSFAMNCVTMATSDALSSMTRKRSTYYSIRTFTWFILAGVVGWPFSMALAIPYGLYVLLSLSFRDIFSIIGGSLISMALIVCLTLLIDSYFYQEVTVVPLNIVLYNVFGGEGVGPEIFGVEPFLYYVLNLLLNFNAISILGYVAILLNGFFYHRNAFKKTLIGSSLPLLIWSFIFGIQAHKEERFLYPIYPFIILNASLLLSKLLPFSVLIAKKTIGGKVNSSVLSKLVHVLFAFLIGMVSVLRIINLVENYSAPLYTYSALNGLSKTDELTNVCTGREWYHYPNSFFMPDNYRLRFVRSGFDGLLPGDFEECEGSWIEASSRIPLDMNNMNQFSESKVIDFKSCDYYIDNSQLTDDKEPSIIKIDGNKKSVKEGWTIKTCNKIINPSGKSSVLGKQLWLPEIIRKFVPYEIDYMDFCLLHKDKPSL